MRCFTYVSGRESPPVAEGIALAKHEKLGEVIKLGVEGRGRWVEYVKLDSRNPPATREGATVGECSLTSFKTGDKTRYVLCKEQPETEDRALLWVHAHGPYTRGCSGSIDKSWGEPQLVVDGHDAWGDAGRLGIIPEALYIMHPGDVIKVTHAGGHKSKDYWLRYGGSGHFETFDEAAYFPMLTDAILAGTIPQEVAQRELEIAKKEGRKATVSAIEAGLGITQQQVL